MFLAEMQQLQALVGSRSSVPKEQVYPRFDSLAKLWAAFREEFALLQARQLTLDTLKQYETSFTATLKPDDLVAARAARRADEALSSGLGHGEAPPSAVPLAEPATEPPRVRCDARGVASATSSPTMLRARSEAEAAEALRGAAQLEGFCAYSAVQRDGLLLVASPTAVAVFRDRLYGFVDAAARDAFCQPRQSITRLCSPWRSACRS